MKTYFDFIRDLQERLAIEDNPNAFTPPADATMTPRERQFAAAFDRRQKSRYGGTMARIAAQVLAKSKARAAQQAPKREPFQWMGIARSGGVNMVAGWWHPQRQWFTFSHNTDGYHLTQIVKHPAKFGISNMELDRGLQAEAERRNANNSLRYDNDGDTHPWTAEEIKKAILKEDIDLSHAVQSVAYQRGWLKVYGGLRPSLEGTDHSSLKAAMRDIAQSAGEDTDVSIEIVGAVPGRNTFKRLRAKDWNSL